MQDHQGPSQVFAESGLYPLSTEPGLIQITLLGSLELIVGP